MVNPHTTLPPLAIPHFTLTTQSNAYTKALYLRIIPGIFLKPLKILETGSSSGRQSKD
jgi:hypothetical protein